MKKTRIYMIIIILLFQVALPMITAMVENSYVPKTLATTIEDNLEYPEEVNIEEQRQALIETANAYYNQGAQIQYDSYRKNYLYSPEDATSQHPVYTVCATFTFQVYYQALGIAIPDTVNGLLWLAEAYNGIYSDAGLKYTLEYYKGTEIYSEEVLGTVSNPNYENLIKEWAQILQPGDIFVVTGHAMLVESVNKTPGEEEIWLIESGGGNYNYNFTNYTDGYDDPNNPTIRKINLKARLKSYYNSYASYTSTQLENLEMALIRAIPDGKHYINQTGYDKPAVKYKECIYEGITESAKSRLNYLGIDIEKIVKISDDTQHILVEPGETLTYEITITNKSNVDYVNSLDIVENIDSNLTIVDNGNGVFEKNQLKWTISPLQAGASTKITYTVKVPVDVSLLGKIIVSTGKADNISTAKIENLIGNKFNNEQKEKIINSYNTLKDNSETTERDFINEIYKNALNLDMGLTNELTNLGGIIKRNANKINYKYRESLSELAYSMEEDEEINLLEIIVNKFANNSLINNSLVINHTELIENTPIREYIYQNFYGLRVTKMKDGEESTSEFKERLEEESLVRWQWQWDYYHDIELNDRARTITPDMLIDGDVLLVYTGDTSPSDTNLINKSYIYLENKLVRKTTTGEFEELSGDELTKFLRNIVCDNYVMLRPSIAIENTLDKGLASMEITTEPKKTTYIEGERFEVEGMEITATYNSGDTAIVTDYIITNGDSLKLGQTSVTISYTENGITKTVEQTISVLEKLKVSIQEYVEVEIDNKNHIKNINANETIEEMKKEIISNGEIKIYKGNAEITDIKEKLVTGMTIRITLRDESKEYIISVTGDVNGDGNVNVRDILAINKHRLNKSKLTGEYLLAGDITGDGEANIRDILQINKYRLGKIDNL